MLVAAKLLVINGLLPRMGAPGRRRPPLVGLLARAGGALCLSAHGAASPEPGGAGRVRGAGGAAPGRGRRLPGSGRPGWSGWCLVLAEHLGVRLRSATPV
ncbi:MAG: hypothetical protein U0Y82_08585 [Thermoleophilia bacterium]